MNATAASVMRRGASSRRHHDRGDHRPLDVDVAIMMSAPERFHV